ncbi:MAG TPA: FAD-binding oxidoreductase [Gaiellaceae bacterium]|nr:FAD-binding oxidoreductase [Gaiellaceae bacterium]
MADVGLEVAVVGAGVVGLAIARELQGRGVRVAVFERTGVGAGASGVQPGGVRQQWGTPIACRLARESAAFYGDADAHLDAPVPLGFRACGYLFVAHTDETLARLAANVAVQNTEGIASRVVTPAEAARLVPGLRAEAIAGGAWCADDGYFDRPQGVVEAFARGLDIRIGAIDSLDANLAETVVVAAGAATADLLRPLGVDLPIGREDRFLFLSEPVRERLLEPLVVSAERRFAAKQLGDGRVLASDLGARGDESQRDVWRANVRAGVEELLPALEYVSFPTLVRGEYDVTPDHQPILGRVREGLYVAAGFSGHGFMIAPAVARIVADAVMGLPPDDALRILDLARFEENRLVPEPQLV